MGESNMKFEMGESKIKIKIKMSGSDRGTFSETGTKSPVGFARGRLSYVIAGCQPHGDSHFAGTEACDCGRCTYCLFSKYISVRRDALSLCASGMRERMTWRVWQLWHCAVMVIIVIQAVGFGGMMKRGDKDG